MPSTTSAEVSANIRAELARQSKPQAALAARLGISQSAVSKRLRGVAGWDLEELILAADFLGTTVEFLIRTHERAAS